MIRVFPSAYWGSIAYFRALCQHEEVIIEKKEHFVKQTGRNRCEILAANGPLSLSIPIKRISGTKTTVDQILLSDEENWRARHWRSFTSAYQSAPFFDYYGMEIEKILSEEFTTLWELNQSTLEHVVEWLDLPVKITFSEQFIEPQENDYRRYLVNKNHATEVEKAPYIQVFPGTQSYSQSLSILDPILCLGPMARNLILQQS